MTNADPWGALGVKPSAFPVSEGETYAFEAWIVGGSARILLSGPDVPDKYVGTTFTTPPGYTGAQIMVKAK